MNKREKKRDDAFKKQREKDDKAVMGMELDDFKKTVLERMGVIEDSILDALDSNRDEHIQIARAVGKINANLKIGARNFKIIDKRLHAVEGVLTFMAVAYRNHAGSPMTWKEKKSLASMLSIDLEATRKDFEKTRPASPLLQDLAGKGVQL